MSFDDEGNPSKTYVKIQPLVENASMMSDLIGYSMDKKYTAVDIDSKSETAPEIIHLLDRWIYRDCA